ncbi:unnamed protein product [Spirodela intermedia]|uniref:Small ribosomal subunit protein mS35 mitochondrial conserved domain-containing protein n=1 Tax=Spirodela intermedia TaxID=51605 RepID=A0A7I8LMA6_SPIIN|nr:unnamed protein product [Spirodela intermedia]
MAAATSPFVPISTASLASPSAELYRNVPPPASRPSPISDSSLLLPTAVTMAKPLPLSPPPTSLLPRLLVPVTSSRLLPPPPWSRMSPTRLKRRIEKYFKGDEEALPSIMEAIMRRKLTGKHEETDDEMMEDLRMKPLQDVKDREFEEDFDELYSTDEDIPDLYNARNHVEQKMVKDEYFNMDERKWDGMVQEAIEKGFVKDTSECERILEDMLKWDNLLPDEIKQKIEARFYELGDMCEKGELQPEEAYELFKEFEDKVVLECSETMLANESTEEEKISDGVTKEDFSNPPGEGPILKWETRAVFAPGGDSWHPKNRKVNLSVTVKELGLSRHAFRRLREIVGKRYHPGRDELVLISERFDHREENRKDCLRTLYALIDDARRADDLVKETRTAYIKDRLRANPKFMEHLRGKLAQSHLSPSSAPL